jgi:hypothetical protein
LAGVLKLMFGSDIRAQLDTHGQLKLPCAPREQWCLAVVKRGRSRLEQLFQKSPGAIVSMVAPRSIPLNGGRSSTGRALDCDSGGSGFKTRRPPHLSPNGYSLANALGKGAC